MLSIEQCIERDENWDQGHSLIDGTDGLNSYKCCRYCKKVWRVSTDPRGHLLELNFSQAPSRESYGEVGHG